ncbi:hypothetical protein [Actinopolymorpha pittospori]
MDAAADTTETTFERLHRFAGDPARARLLHRALEVLAVDETRPALRDFARDVLQGRMEVRAAALSSAYAEALGADVRHFVGAYRALSAAERAERVTLAQRYLETLRGGDGAT